MMRSKWVFCTVAVINMCFGVYTFAQSEDNGLFDEYLYGPLHVESYKTTYFMPFLMDFDKHDDREPVEVSFQISFKKDIVENISPIGFDIGIAFTQTAWWQLYAFSNPFRETNYEPELYVYFPFNKEHEEEGIYCRGIKAAAIHESNGKSGEDNRSWNRICLEAPISIKWFLLVPRIWWSFVGIGNDFSEKDIPRYMGMGDLTVITGWNKHVMKIYGRSNFNFKNIAAALRIDYSYPITATGYFLYLQYFVGYGESLIDYNRTVQKIGTGFAFSR